MKKHLLNRNEQLFNKLFENQGISIKELDVAQKTAWVALEEDEEEGIDESSVNLIADPDKLPNDKEDTEATASDPGSEEEELPESLSPQAADKIERAMNPIKQVLKTIDTEDELIDFMSRMMRAISDLNNNQLTSSEIKRTLRNMLGNDDNEISEGKDNPYAICTASVGRDDEEKYKSCKDQVAAKNK